MFYYLSCESGNLPDFLHGILKGQPYPKTWSDAIKVCSYPNDQMGFVFYEISYTSPEACSVPSCSIYVNTCMRAHIHTNNVHTEDRELRYQH